MQVRKERWFSTQSVCTVVVAVVVAQQLFSDTKKSEARERHSRCAGWTVVK